MLGALLAFLRLPERKALGSPAASPPRRSVNTVVICCPAWPSDGYYCSGCVWCPDAAVNHKELRGRQGGYSHKSSSSLCPSKPFQCVPVHPTPGSVQYSCPNGVPCHGTLAAAPLSPPQDNIPPLFLWWLKTASPDPAPSCFYGRANSKTTANLVCLNYHRGFLVLSPCGLVCDNPEHGFPWH